jgi:hypothetical protein
VPIGKPVALNMQALRFAGLRRIVPDGLYTHAGEASANIIISTDVGIQAPAPQAGIGGLPRFMLVNPPNTPPPPAL